MSYFDDASLVMIPSGYKTSKVYSVKPTSGDGDLTFTRSNDTATRVGPDGLIEKVRENLILQSNSFDTTWINDNTSETSGQAGYDGTNNAWLLDSTGGFIQQNISLSGLYTFSVYAKKGTADGIRLRINAGTDANCYIDLNDGTEILATTGVYLSVVSVGSGWYRIGLAINDSAIADVRFYAVDLSGINTTGNIYIQDSQVEAGDIATDYIATTTAAVSVGPVANVPRLDYLNSSCPRLLLEPQRTNLVTYSEQLDNADWTKTNVTITANDEVSPDGYTNADKITDNANNTQHRVTQTISVTSGTSYTASIFVKNDDKGDFAINFTASGFSSTQIVFNLINGTVTSGTGTIQDYGNGWYRISATAAANATGSGTIGFNLGNGGSYVGSEESVFIYGGQIEEGSYVSSYIPSLGAAVTRGADAASKTGISSLIGQTEGTIYSEFNVGNLSTDTRLVATISSGSSANFVSAIINGTDFIARIRANTGSLINVTKSSLAVGTHKIAIAYAASDLTFYLDGVLVGQNTSASVAFSAALSEFTVGVNIGGVANELSGGVSQTILFPTRLSNADLAALTA